MSKFGRILITMLIFTVSGTVFAHTNITVFAAASLTNAMETIAKNYTAAHPEVNVVFSFASSSILARQIEQGAPADIFISADQTWMDYLIERNIVTQKTTLLNNALVLIAPTTSPLEPLTISNTTDWSILLPSHEKIAVGDPDHVPAGLYAKESLTYLGTYQTLAPQMARASNVRDALMLVERQEAPLGIVYSTDAKVSDNVKIIATFPAESFKAIEYPIALLNDRGQAFYTYLLSEPAQAVFKQYGFITQ